MRIDWYDDRAITERGNTTWKHRAVVKIQFVHALPRGGCLGRSIHCTVTVLQKRGECILLHFSTETVSEQFLDGESNLSKQILFDGGWWVLSKQQTTLVTMLNKNRTREYPTVGFPSKGILRSFSLPRGRGCDRKVRYTMYNSQPNSCTVYYW